MAATTLSPATETKQVGFFPKVLWALDYIPLISTGKGLADLALARFWKPGRLDNLSYYSKHYYHHLADKENVRYIAIIPFVGNGILLVQDCGEYVAKQNELSLVRNAELGRNEAMEQLYQGTPEQRAKALECFYKEALGPAYCNARTARRFLLKILCGKECPEKQKVQGWFLQNFKRFGLMTAAEIYEHPNLPHEVELKILDFCISEMLSGRDIIAGYLLSKLIKARVPAEKDRIIAMIRNVAEGGNRVAFDFLNTKLLWEDRSYTKAHFDWVASRAETFSSPMSNFAWEILKNEYHFKRDAIFPLF